MGYNHFNTEYGENCMNLKKLLILTAGIICAILLYNGVSVIEEYTNIAGGKEEVSVSIPKGASGKTISEILKENGVIKSEIAFRLKLKSSPDKENLNYGTFKMKKHLGYGKIIDILKKPTEMTGSVKLTIPEGFSAEMIGARLESLGISTKEEFLKELNEGDFDFDFIKKIKADKNVKYTLQGYLFPNTYMINKNASARDVINILLSEFEKQYNEIKKEYKVNGDLNTIITLASLIERESKLDSERKKISGVLQNRLKKNMLLQIDATVVYLISDGMYDVNRVYYKDLKVKSPYNTYYSEGLPPGAICNPGKESIVAAIKPEKHSYLFYHTDTDKNDGSHIFNETLEAHNQSK